MNKLSRKVIWGMILILGASCVITVLLNTNFLEKYYLYQKKSSLNQISAELADGVRQGSSSEDMVHQIENDNKVIIAKIDSNTAVSSETVNNEIRQAFQEKGIGFQKYWLWEEDYQEILDGGTKIRLYEQEKLNYSLLVKYVQIQSEMFAISMIVPNIADAFGIINQFLIAVNVICIIASILFLGLFIQRITKPLAEFKRFASQMKENSYVPLDIRTKDELESVADSLNLMGSQIIAYQNSLHEKNEQMEQLLDNVAHDLKTPIALIQLYAGGIRDGLDDGTFLDTIESESRQMADMAEKLLFSSRISQRQIDMNQLNLTELLENVLAECEVLGGENSIRFCCELENDIIVPGSYELMKSLFTNLVTNAVKYSSGNEIHIRLKRLTASAEFTITNQTENCGLDLTQIWNPYYVGEVSRNKTLSGTGLGLTIVRKICEKLGYTVDCSLENREIAFRVRLPL